MDDIQKLKDELNIYKESIAELEDKLERAYYWMKKDNINEVINRATRQGMEIEKLKEELDTARFLNDKNNIGKICIKATKFERLSEEQGREIEKLKEEIQKLKNENLALKENGTKVNDIDNKRGAGRKEKFSDLEKETIKMYRIQGKTIKEIAEIYSCSTGLIHKIINKKEEK